MPPVKLEYHIDPYLRVEKIVVIFDTTLGVEEGNRHEVIVDVGVVLIYANVLCQESFRCQIELQAKCTKCKIVGCGGRILQGHVKKPSSCITHCLHI